MWSTIAKTVARAPRPLADKLIQQHLRTTFILKRRVAVPLQKKGHYSNKMRSRHYVYDLIEDTGTKKQAEIDVILTTYVESLGNAGDKVSVKSHQAYENLLLPGRAVYATPENVKNFENKEIVKDVVRYTSPNVPYMIDTFSRMVLALIMNKDVPWKVEPWHIRASFRKCGYVVPEETITMPPREITGPDMTKEGKLFYITVTINNTEKALVRCRIHHWSTEISEKLPYEEKFWTKPMEPIFPEDSEIINSIPNQASKFKTQIETSSL